MRKQVEADPGLALLVEEVRRAEGAGAPWTPQDGPQRIAFECDADQIGYGGAAGGGKTDLALGLAICKHQRSIIFRREFPNARGIVERSRDLLHATGRYNETLHLWRLPGKLIEIGSMLQEKDKFNHQGQARDLHVFDEATEFTESQVRFVIGWNRSTTHAQCQVLLTFNPPMSETGEWIERFFAPWLDPDYLDPAMDGEFRYVVMDGDHEVFSRDKPDGEHKTRTFFHASLADNPALATTGYGSTIEAMPEPLRSILKGNFHTAKLVDPWQVIPSAWVDAAQQRWQARETIEHSAVGMDVARGGDDQTVIARLAWGWVAPLDVYPGRATPDGPTAAALLVPYLTPGVRAGVDVIGVGASAYDTLHSQGLRVMGINFAEGTSELDKTKRLKFRNVRAAAYWKLREALDPALGNAALVLPPDKALAQELKAPKWSITTAGILIESKEDIVARLHRSPDRADAVALAVYAQSRPSPEHFVAFVGDDDAD